MAFVIPRDVSFGIWGVDNTNYQFNLAGSSPRGEIILWYPGTNPNTKWKFIHQRDGTYYIQSGVVDGSGRPVYVTSPSGSLFGGPNPVLYAVDTTAYPFITISGANHKYSTTHGVGAQVTMENRDYTLDLNPPQVFRLRLNE